MNNRFKLVDPIFRSIESKNGWLCLKENKKSIYRIFRVFSGSCNITDEFTGKTTSAKTNYFYLPFLENSQRNIKSIEDSFNGEIKINALASEFKKIKENKEFYDLLEPEIVACIIARNEGRILESFLFLYRSLEGISYSIPLIYISKQRNFKKSFNALKNYMPKKSGEGELAFFKKFIQETLMENNDELRSPIRLSLDSLDLYEIKPLYYRYYIELAKGKIIESEEDESISFSFDQFYEFLIELRNRYFHFLQGTWQNNVSTEKVVYPDLFFKPVIDLGINWLATIFYEVIKFEMNGNDSN
jgi:hypothetical protein